MCQKLREEFPSNSLPVIMLSAKGSEDDIVQGLAVGCNGQPRHSRPSIPCPMMIFDVR